MTLPIFFFSGVLFTYSFLVVLGVRSCMDFPLAVASRGDSSCSMQASRCRGFSCGAWAEASPPVTWEVMQAVPARGNERQV